MQRYPSRHVTAEFHRCGTVRWLPVVAGIVLAMSGRCEALRAQHEPGGERKAAAGTRDDDRAKSARALTAGALTAGAWLEEGKRIVVAIDQVGFVEIELLGKLVRYRLREENGFFVKLVHEPSIGRTIGVTWDGRVYMWKANDHRVTHWRSTLRSISSFCLWGKNHGLAIASWHGKVQTLRPDGTLVQEIGGHEGAVLSVAGCGKTRTIATGGRDRKVILWDAVTGEQRWASELDSSVGAVELFDEGRRLLTGTYVGTCTLWDVTTKRRIRAYRPSRALMPVRSFARGDDWFAAIGVNDWSAWSLPSASPLYVMRAEPSQTLTYHVDYVAIDNMGRYLLLISSEDIRVFKKPFLPVFRMELSEIIDRLGSDRKATPLP